MASLVVGTFLTLDGVMQGPGGPDEDRSGGFAHGGCSVGYWDGPMGEIITDWTANADALLLGRTTYEIFAAHWPHVPDDDPVGVVLNRVPKYVASTTLKSVEWNNSMLLEGDVPGAVSALKEARNGEIQVHGSCGLLQTLIQHDLIDEYRLWTFPVLLGSGRRLFNAGTIPAGLELIDSTTSSTGVVINRTVAQATSGTARSKSTSEEESRRSGRRGKSADRDACPPTDMGPLGSSATRHASLARERRTSRHSRLVIRCGGACGSASRSLRTATAEWRDRGGMRSWRTPPTLPVLSTRRRTGIEPAWELSPPHRF